MYGNKIWITGMTMIMAFPSIFTGLPWELFGAVIAIFGCILIWLDK